MGQNPNTIAEHSELFMYATGNFVSIVLVIVSNYRSSKVPIITAVFTFAVILANRDLETTPNSIFCAAHQCTLTQVQSSIFVKTPRCVTLAR